MFVYINCFLNLDLSLVYMLENSSSMTKTAKQNLHYRQAKREKKIQEIPFELINQYTLFIIIISK